MSWNNRSWDGALETQQDIARLKSRDELHATAIKTLWREIDKLTEANEKLTEDNKTLMGMIEKMWYAPGMPGAPEAPDHPSFKK